MTKPTITNMTDIPLMLAVWAVHDEYDYISTPNYISATSLLKPLRHLILPPRIQPEFRKPEDVADYLSRGLGHTIHDGIEKAWKRGYRVNLKKLGYPESVIDRILINPSDQQLDSVKDPIPVYLEQRVFRPHKGYIIGGKYDGVADGIVNDTKTTSTFKWTKGGGIQEFQLQGSIYRWLDAKGFSDEGCHPDSSFRPRIIEDYMQINFVFTDWKKIDALRNPGYPQKRTEKMEVPLLSLDETESFIDEKLRLIQKYKDVPEADLPECTPEELWQSDPQYKYYKDPANANKPNARSTKNFDDLGEANRFMAEKGGVGIIKTIPGEPKRCSYCPAFDICTQKNRYF